MPIHVRIIPLLIYGVVFIIGLLNAIKPRFMWKTFESWKATKEPTNSFFVVRRVSGIIAMLIIIALILYPYLLSR